MEAIDLRSPMLVKDAMSSPAITVNLNEMANKIAQLMDKYHIGCVIVNTNDPKPIGIITERDIVTRVVAKNAQPSNLIAKQVMSTPLQTIESEQTISDAARRMSRLDVRRLAVMYKGNLAGIITSKDILAVTPELLEIIQEKTRIENHNMTEEAEETPPSAGYCDSCGIWSDDLKETEGSFLCEDCRTELVHNEY